MSYLNILFWDYICYNFLSFFIYTVLGKANQKKKKKNWDPCYSVSQ